MMSKAELARKAGLSTLTIDRVEAGRPCRLETKRKILLALGLKVLDKERLFGLAVQVAGRVLASLDEGRPASPISRSKDLHERLAEQVALPLPQVEDDGGESR